jgi:Co/Zn/Cd efflux system component
MLQDGVDGSWSSKRVVTFLAFIFCSIAFFANMFFGVEVKEYMFEGMMVIAIAGLGVTVTERFADKKSSSNKYNNNIRGTPLPRYHQEEI